MQIYAFVEIENKIKKVLGLSKDNFYALEESDQNLIDHPIIETNIAKKDKFSKNNQRRRVTVTLSKENKKTYYDKQKNLVFKNKILVFDKVLHWKKFC